MLNDELTDRLKVPLFRCRGKEMTCLTLSPEGTQICKKKKKKKAFIQYCQHNSVQTQLCVQTKKRRKEKEECRSSVTHISEHATANSEM
jgi:hypothetical protein